MQDPKKESKDIQKPSLKDKLKQYNKDKKDPLKGGTEMGKPSLKAGFEDAMQKERDFVLNRAKKREAAEKMGREKLTRFVKEVKELPETIVKVPVKKEGVGEAILVNLASGAERLVGGAKRVIENMSGSKKPKLLKSMSKDLKKSKY